MKFNDVLEAFNKSIDNAREKKSILVRGFFTSYAELKKNSMGPYKTCCVRITFINKDYVSTPIIVSSVTDRCLEGKEELLITKAETAALTKLFILCQDNDIWENIVEGTYGNK